MDNVSDLVNRYNSLKARRDGYYLPVWREVRKYVYPNYSDYLPEGGERGFTLFDKTAIEARKRLAAVIYNWMAPPDKRWFELEAENDELAANDDVKDYFAETSKRVAFAMANSNWPSVLIQVLNELAAGFDGVVYIEDGGPDAALNCRCFPIESVVYVENNHSTIDTVFREYKESARNLACEFGLDNLPEKIRADAANPKKMDASYSILHAVIPRDKRAPGLRDNKNMPFADLYIALDAKHIIHESGFQEFPFSVCRFEKADNEIYGRGPGLDNLPAIRLINRVEEALALGIDFASDPGWMVPDGSLVSDVFDRDPGAINVYKPTMSGAKPEPVIRAFNPATLDNYRMQRREEIRLGFFNDICDPLAELKNITATEAEIRENSKIIPFAPIAGNLHNELFKPVIHRVIGILARRGELPDPPEILVDAPDYKIEFVSKIALSIKKLESLGWVQTEAALAGIAQIQPDIFDNFKFDELSRDVALVNGAAPKWLRNVRDRDAIRNQRADAQAQEQALQQLAGAAAAAPDLDKAPEPGSPMSQIMSNQGV